MTAFKLERVQYVPKELAQGVLYVSHEFAVACHLCACGCGNKVTTPLGPAEWTFTERNGFPTLTPSVGNWQLPCRSHYFINYGQVQWAAQWSDAAIAAGRGAELQRRQVHYDQQARMSGIWNRIWAWLRSLFS